MEVRDLLKINNITCITSGIDLTKPISSLYASDLLSWVMGHVREENTVLLTVLNSINIIAVAVLLDLSAVIFCDGVEPSKDIVAKAIAEKIPLFITDFSSAQSIKAIDRYESLL
ncbi:MAG TPA: AraC family transcriptional regulator [Bacilli bacterium]|nr:AraC family transcriptional regulator [Bacilli bacterium]